MVDFADNVFDPLYGDRLHCDFALVSDLPDGGEPGIVARTLGDQDAVHMSLSLQDCKDRIAAKDSVLAFIPA